jgi:hypothetical protein
MVKKELPLQPATKDKKCQVCGSEYTYPEKGSHATRFHCHTCAALPEAIRKILTKMSKRIQTLERKLK